MTQRWPILVFALVMAALPIVPALPPFWIVLLTTSASPLWWRWGSCS